MIAARASCRPPLSTRRPRGVALVVVLLILVIVTVLGVGGARIALMGERSTRFDRDSQVAFEGAEAALMDAEFDIRGPGGSRSAQFTQTNTGLFVSGCGTSSTGRGLCQQNAEGVKPIWAADTLIDSGSSARSVEFGTYTSRTFESGGGGLRPARAPRYVIELIDDQTPGGNAAFNPSGGQPVPKMYRVTSMGFGPREETQSVVQMTFRKEKN